MTKKEITERLISLGHTYMRHNYMVNKIASRMQVRIDQGVEVPEALERQYERRVVLARSIQLEMEALEIKLSKMR
jgi:hypothetical protein